MIQNNYRINEPDLCTLLDYTEQLIKKDINCISIGTIQSFDPITQTATITINYTKWISGQITGQDFDGKAIAKPSTTEPYPPIVSCPVIVLGGGGSYLTFPIANGDTCLVLFCDREIDTWMTYGGNNSPQAARMHSLNDAVAIVGLHNLVSPIQNYNSIGPELRFAGSKINIDAAGSITESSAKDLTILASGNLTETIKGSSSSTILGQDTITASHEWINAPVTASGNMSIVGALGVTGTFGFTGNAAVLGAWVSENYNTVYGPTTTDGFVVAYCGQDTIENYGYTDGSSNPGTVRARCESYSSGDERNSMCFLVRKGDYWKVANNAVVFYIPFGSSN